MINFSWLNLNIKQDKPIGRSDGPQLATDFWRMSDKIERPVKSPRRRSPFKIDFGQWGSVCASLTWQCIDETPALQKLVAKTDGSMREALPIQVYLRLSWGYEFTTVWRIWSSTEYLAIFTHFRSHTRIIGKGNLFEFATMFTQLTAQSCTGQRGNL